MLQYIKSVVNNKLYLFEICPCIFRTIKIMIFYSLCYRDLQITTSGTLTAIQKKKKNAICFNWRKAFDFGSGLSL